MKTVLITGCSSGFGLASARLFLSRGWKVVATMRSTREDLFVDREGLRVLPLDVTDAGSIAAAIDAAGPVDVLVNNAGVGMLNALEGTDMAKVREVFETNTLGTIAMSRAVIPQMRARGAGTIINVTSTVTLRPLHLLSVYAASKAAVNAFTESLALELAPFGVRARLVLPGMAPSTEFGANARARMGLDIPDAYGEIAAQILERLQEEGQPLTLASDVAEAVWRAATEADVPMRLPAGADAHIWAREAGLEPA